jgi:glycosyltransferase involved in cell wall biosynthesis
MAVEISFVMPAWNEEALIGHTLDRLRAAADALGETYEVIVVDDASTDRTAAIAQERGAQVVPVEKRQIAAVRNAGAAVARGRHLFFVDADTVVPAETLALAWRALGEGAIGGGARFVLEGRIPWPARIYIICFMAVWRPMRVATGCFLFARRDAFEAAGGWDERYFAGEELYLSRALKRQGRFVIVRHPVISSGRKARLLALRDVLRLTWRALRHGPRTLRQREGLEAWYVSLREGAAGDGPPGPRR